MIDNNEVAINPIQFTHIGNNQTPIITVIPVMILKRWRMATIPKMVPERRSQKVFEFILNVN